MIVCTEVLTAPEPAPKGIPGFWLQVIKNSALAQAVEAHDEPLLEHLEDLSYELLPNNEGYRLVFRFSENDYFTNTELVKTVKVEDMFGEEEIISTQGTTIDWKPNKNITVQLKSKPAPSSTSRTPTWTRRTLWRSPSSTRWTASSPPCFARRSLRVRPFSSLERVRERHQPTNDVVVTVPSQAS